MGAAARPLCRLSIRSRPVAGRSRAGARGSAGDGGSPGGSGLIGIPPRDRRAAASRPGGSVLQILVGDPWRPIPSGASPPVDRPADKTSGGEPRRPPREWKLAERFARSQPFRGSAGASHALVTIAGRPPSPGRRKSGLRAQARLIRPAAASPAGDAAAGSRPQCPPVPPVITCPPIVPWPGVAAPAFCTTASTVTRPPFSKVRVSGKWAPS